MNKYLTTLLIFGFILAMEAVPFLYNDSYTSRDMKWGWIVGMPLVFLIYSFVKNDKASKD